MSRFSSIVVGVDFSQCSAVALGQALRIAGWSGGALHVVHVLDTLVVTELEEALSMQEGVRDGLVSDARKAWREFAARVPGAERLPIEVAIDNRSAGILKRARQDQADLLVLGALGESGMGIGVGTVASACVRKSAADVLLVCEVRPRAGAAPFQTIVAAVDFSPTSLRAVEEAAAIATHDGAGLHVLHVFQAPWHRLHYRAPTPEAAPHFQKQYRDCLERRLHEFCRPALEAQASPRAHFVVHDYAGHRSGIVDYAQSVSADLIVLGTRGRANLRDVLLGSTAEKALQESACSILAVKPEEFEHAPATAAGS
ncbi:MAG: universal stress protein [Planctomycetota bacterium]|nr:MAG: universal stress protein [Planctomycetota bacterium]